MCSPAYSLWAIWASISIWSLTLSLGYSCLEIKYCSPCRGWFHLHPERNFSGSCLEICCWSSCSNKTLGQQSPWDLTGVNLGWVLCCTSSLVWDNSNCLWNLFTYFTYSLCNCFSLSSNSPTVLAASKSKSKLSLSASTSWPLLCKIVGFVYCVTLLWAISIFTFINT